MEKALTMAQLPYHSGIKLRVYPSDLQKKIIKRNSDDARATYNQLVEYGKQQFELEQLGVRTFEQQVELEKIRDFEASSKSMKELLPFLDVKEHDSLCTAQAIASYKAAWNMFRKIGSHNPPTFHKRNDNFQRYQSANNYPGSKSKDLYNGSVRFINKNTIQIPKVGKLRVSGSHKKLLTLKHAIRIGSITIKKEADDCYYVSLALASEKPFKTIKKTNHKTASIDLNTSNFLTTSDGKTVENPRYYRTLQSTLAKAQRDLNRKRRRAEKEKRQLKDSKNYQKQRKVVAKIHKKIANQRENFLQTLSTKLIKNHDLLVAEDLQSKNMMKNHSMALSIADVGWRSFLSMLRYKAERYDVDFRLVDPKNTTQTCSVCGFVKTKDGIGGIQALSGDSIHRKHSLYHCFNCGVDLDRDLNATQNILARGLAQ